MSLDFIFNKTIELATREQLVIFIKEMQKENKVLEERLAEFENWKARATQYEESEIRETGTIVIKNTKNNFYYCPVCFEGKKVISLQPYGSCSKICPDCKANYDFKNADYSTDQPSYDPLS